MSDERKRDSEWHPIPGFLNYRVNKLGQVWSAKANKIMSPAKSIRGYLRLTLSQNRRKIGKGVSEIVLRAFVGPRPAGFQAAHLNGNKLDNRLSNLKWCSVLENERHKILHGTRVTGSKNGQAKLTEEMVRVIRQIHRPRGSEFPDTLHLAYCFQVHPHRIKAIIKGDAWKHVKDVKR